MLLDKRAVASLARSVLSVPAINFPATQHVPPLKGSKAKLGLEALQNDKEVKLEAVAKTQNVPTSTLHDRTSAARKSTRGIGEAADFRIWEPILGPAARAFQPE